jgi:hypothetical protein
MSQPIQHTSRALASCKASECTNIVNVLLFLLSRSIGHTTLCREVSETRSGSGYGALLRQEADQANFRQKYKKIMEIPKRTTLSYPVLIYFTSTQLHLKSSNSF